MKRGLSFASAYLALTDLSLPALAVPAFALVLSSLAATPPAMAQQAGQMGTAEQCNQFTVLNQATQVKANAVQAAMKSQADRKEICKLMTVFVGAESNVVKFLVDNKTWCGVPDPIIVQAKAAHEKSVKFRDTVCTEAPAPKAPTLSDAIKTTPVDSAANTNVKRGGTFDTLTGNPLGR